jgi:hypothetical protein
VSNRATTDESAAFDRMLKAFTEWLEVRESEYMECISCQRGMLQQLERLRRIKQAAPNASLLMRIQELHTELGDLKGTDDE